jgi:hypothetical protein
MILNIRGTSGAGKTTLVRKLVNIKSADKVYKDGRRNPICYQSDNTILLGSYESECGGCDTIHSLGEIFELVDFYAKNGYNVVMEGLLLSEEVKRTIALATIYKAKIIVLDTSLEKCLSQINERRLRKNPSAEPVNPKNTTNRFSVINRALERLKLSGVDAEAMPFKRALSFCKKVLHD